RACASWRKWRSRSSRMAVRFDLVLRWWPGRAQASLLTKDTAAARYRVVLLAARDVNEVSAAATWAGRQKKSAIATFQFGVCLSAWASAARRAWSKPTGSRES